MVNAANNRMRGGGGVDGAIHRAGGPAVLEDCRRRFPHGLATGDAGWTTAGDMAARWVIHVVGPNRNAGQTDRSLLTSCYSRALEVADELGARSVAFPLVSAGVYGWPKDDAVAAALEVLRGRGHPGRGGPDRGVRPRHLRPGVRTCSAAGDLDDRRARPGELAAAGRRAGGHVVGEVRLRCGVRPVLARVLDGDEDRAVLVVDRPGRRSRRRSGRRGTAAPGHAPDRRAAP